MSDVTHDVFQLLQNRFHALTDIDHRRSNKWRGKHCGDRIAETRLRKLLFHILPVGLYLCTIGLLLGSQTRMLSLEPN